MPGADRVPLRSRSRYLCGALDLSPSGSDSWQHFGNVQIVQCFQKPDDLDDLDAAGRIYTF
jgi:hypothetical protein